MATRCPKCNYDLSGLDEHPCPECGLDYASRCAADQAQRYAETAAAFLAVFPGAAIICMAVLGFIISGLGALFVVAVLPIGISGRLLFIGMHVLAIACAFILFSTKQVSFNAVYRYFAIAIAIDLIAFGAMYVLVSNATLTA